jgi:multiple antibiotic resistance protein
MWTGLLYNFIALVVIIDPVGTAALFAALTRDESEEYRRRAAIRGVAIATIVMLAFAVIGEFILGALGIGIPAFRIAGGLLLFLLATEMVFARHSGIRATTAAEDEETMRRADISVFPLAIPFLAGPGSLTFIVLLMRRAPSLEAAALVVATLILVMALSLALLLASGRVVALLGITGTNVVSRVLGIVLAALAVQLVLDGLVGAAILR